MSERGIRGADRAELERLREIERLAGAAFRDLDMASIADDEPPSIETLTGYVADSRAWVATAPDGVAVGYLLLDVIDGCGHIEQVSVDPSYRGRGTARRVVQGVSQGLDPTQACREALQETIDLPDEFRAPLQALSLLPDGSHGGAATRGGATYSVMTAEDTAFRILERAAL